MLPEITAWEVASLLAEPYRFGECVDLQGRTITGALDLSGSQFGGVNMDGCVFNGPVNFSAGVFQGLCWFKGVTFLDSVDFSAVRFCSDARFDGATFENSAHFSSSVFWGVACFDDISALKTMSLNGITAYGNLSLARCRFHYPLEMAEAELMGGLWSLGTPSKQLRGLDKARISGRIEQ